MMCRLLIVTVLALSVAGCNSPSPYQTPVQSAAANQSMMNTGLMLMAAGQRMTPQQRAAILSGTPMPPTYVAPAPMMRTTNCTATGNMLNCNSF